MTHLFRMIEKRTFLEVEGLSDCSTEEEDDSVVVPGILRRTCSDSMVAYDFEKTESSEDERRSSCASTQASADSLSATSSAPISPAMDWQPAPPFESPVACEMLPTAQGATEPMWPWVEGAQFSGFQQSVPSPEANFVYCLGWLPVSSAGEVGFATDAGAVDLSAASRMPQELGAMAWQLEALAAQHLALAGQMAECARPPLEPHATLYEPGLVDSASKPAAALPHDVQDEPTTLMMRNLPTHWQREQLLHMLDTAGFRGFYDFVYLPVNFEGFSCFGYAFVNFCSHEQAVRAWATFGGAQVCQEEKAIEVSWSRPLQGLEAHVARYRNSPVMSEEVPDSCRPLLFKDGQLIPFPAPEKRIRPPRRHKLTHRGIGASGCAPAAAACEG
eukprot:gb/GFBE01049029.1/.p1 GENE.gb/GFBE01049029.1/~~gb/GFBE01049029.1/.p1  ORF type:complete len:388 (+),score=67.56 gb/GFBE01049029.1/:1-1164(+)